MSVYQPTPVFGGKAGSRPFWPLTPSAMSWAYVGMEPSDAYFSMRSGRMPSDAKNSDLSACGAGVYDSTRALAVPSSPWPTTIVKTASRPTKLSRRRRCIVPPPPRLCTGDPVDAAERATPTAKPIPACLLGSRRQMANSRRSTRPRAGPRALPCAADGVVRDQARVLPVRGGVRPPRTPPPVPLRRAAPRGLRTRRRRGGRGPGCGRGEGARGDVAVPRAAAGGGPRADRPPRRGGDAAARDAPPGPFARGLGPARQGRRAEPDGLVQVPRRRE